MPDCAHNTYLIPVSQYVPVLLVYLTSSSVPVFALHWLKIDNNPHRDCEFLSDKEKRKRVNAGK